MKHFIQNFSKVFEIVLYYFIYPYIHNQISPHQNEFVIGRSTITYLTVFAEYITHVLDNRGDGINADFSKTFDRIDHKFLLYYSNTTCTTESSISVLTPLVTYNF